MNKLKNIFHKMKEIKKITYEDITIDNLNAEIHRVKYKNSFGRLLRSTVYVLIIIVAISSICATLFMPVIEITDSSMKPLFNDGDIVLTVKDNKFKTGDIVAFYHGNKILIKRVIGVESDFVNIDKDGIVYVNGKKLKENYVKELKKGDSDIKYPVQVSDGSIFVLSDDRDVLTDSRTINVGQIKTSDVIGKIILKVWPLK